MYHAQRVAVRGESDAVENKGIKVRLMSDLCSFCFQKNPLHSHDKIP